MAVITKYVIVRNGVELDKVFEDKKLAEAYDKMLDAAEALAAFIKQGDLELDLSDEKIDQIAVFLAKNGPEVANILKGVKPVQPKKAAASQPATAEEASGADTAKKPGKKAAPKSKEN